MDLSDMWINLVTTKRQMKEFGHQAADMIVQCSYNSKDCFNTRLAHTKWVESPYEYWEWGSKASY